MKKITLTYAQVVDAWNVLGYISRPEMELEPAKALAVMRVMRALAGHYEDFSKVRDILVRAHSRPNEKGEMALDQDKIEVLNKKLQSVLEQVVEVETETVKLSFFSGNISPGVLYGLGPLFEDTDGPPSNTDRARELPAALRAIIEEA